ncbi:MAG: hypothetical protein JWO09_3005 [Bacteroidetes bacterium]|nr:hypothetical protein [Bacteroidota bacterium]
MKKTLSLLLFTAVIISLRAQPAAFQWARVVGGANKIIVNHGNAITTDAAGNVYTTGYFGGTVDFDPGTGTANLTSAGDYDVFILKLTASGSLAWAKRIGSSSDDAANSIAIDASGNIYTIGRFQGTVDFDPGTGTASLSATGYNDVFILKLDAAGNYVWAKRFGGATGNAIGNSIVTDAAGNIYGCGTFYGTVDFDPGTGLASLSASGSYDAFITKLDGAGNLVWARNLDGTSDIYGNSVAADAAGNVYSTGYFYGTADFDPGTGTFPMSYSGYYDTYILKLDAAGDFAWAKDIAGTSDVYAVSITADPAGNIYTTGYFEGTADFDPDTASIYNLSCTTTASFVFISKLNSAGNFVWAKSMASSFGSVGNAVTLDAAGNVYTTGYFNQTTDFDPGPASADLTCTGGDDAFISKLDASGNFLWAGNMGGSGSTYTYGNSITTDGAGNIYTTGNLQGTADFDPGSGSFSLTSTGITGLFVHKMSQPGQPNEIQENTLNQLIVYPNPGSGEFIVVLPEITSDTWIEIYSATGKLIKRKQVNTLRMQINLLEYADGLYFIKIISDHKTVAAQRLLKID